MFNGQEDQAMSRSDGGVASLFWHFVIDENGVSAIEYGLLAAGIAVAIIATVAALGTSLNDTYQSVSNGLE
jgi:pilus assembly protein Flp/PilA